MEICGTQKHETAKKLKFPPSEDKNKNLKRLPEKNMHNLLLKSNKLKKTTIDKLKPKLNRSLTSMLI